MFNFSNFKDSQSTRCRASHLAGGRARPGVTRRPETPTFWRRRSPSPGPVASQTRARLTPPPSTLRLSRETINSPKPVQPRPASPPPSYEDFLNSRPVRPIPSSIHQNTRTQDRKNRTYPHFLRHSCYTKGPANLTGKRHQNGCDRGRLSGSTTCHVSEYWQI